MARGPEEQEISIDHALACFLALPLFAGVGVGRGVGWAYTLVLS